MANYKLTFYCSEEKSDTIEILSGRYNTSIIIKELNKKEPSIIVLDKSTAIKFAKTLRTEINKLEDVNNEFDELSNLF